MDISEIRRIKKDAEEQIEIILARFEQESTMIVKEIKVSRHIVNIDSGVETLKVNINAWI